MKTNLKLAVFALCLTALMPAAHAQLTIPGADGSDGALNITTNTVIDLSQAVTGVWDANNTANAGKGVYDPNKWAVVFKYSSVNIASNCTVTFSNHPSRAPVVWLVNGAVVVSGHLSLDAQSFGSINYDNVRLPEPGPGGFRGGARGQGSLSQGGGFGPGGHDENYGGGYSYGWGGYASGSLSYGNPQIVPLIGGSGGSGWPSAGSVNGFGGGGAILIAASSVITLSADSRISANCNVGGNQGYGGSGGAVRLVADQILGSGRVEALSAYPGRVRIEANTASPALDLNPSSAVVAPVPLVIWPAANAPAVRVLSIGGQSAPLDPRAAMSPSGDDVTIADSGPVNIVLQTANFPTNGAVLVMVKPRNGGQGTVQASFVSGNADSALWQATAPLPLSHAIIQVRATAN